MTLSKPLSVIFMGGRQAGCIGLLTALGVGRCEVLGAVAHEDLFRGFAELFDVPTFDSMREASLKPLLKRSDLLICVHGLEVVPKALLELPRLGGINVHPCLYAYKGLHPIERLLRDGSRRASVGVHRMTERIDVGEVLVEEFVDIGPRRTIEEVYNLLYPLYATVLFKALQEVHKEAESALAHR